MQITYNSLSCFHVNLIGWYKIIRTLSGWKSRPNFSLYNKNFVGQCIFKLDELSAYRLINKFSTVGFLGFITTHWIELRNVKHKLFAIEMRLLYLLRL